MAKIRKIGLYGGTFDPLHNAHLELAEWVCSELNLDLLYFIPAATHALKYNSNITPIQTRYEMLTATIRKYSNFKVSCIEMDKEIVSYTIDTLREFRDYEKIGNAELYFIVGLDNLSELHLWKDYDEIFRIVKLVVLQRPGFKISNIVEQYKNRVTYLDSPLLEISSTEIRRKISCGEGVGKIVPEEVLALIKKYGLYKS